LAMLHRSFRAAPRRPPHRGGAGSKGSLRPK
jgi:hypothetical protein